MIEHNLNIQTQDGAGFNNIGLVTDAGGPKLDGSDP